MYRRILIAGLVSVGTILHLAVDAGAQPKPDGKDQSQGKEIYVIMTARLFEVDEAFHNKLAKAKWLSKADLEELETRPPVDDGLFTLLPKQKLFLAGTEINIDPGKQGVLLTTIKPLNFLPAPDQLRQGKQAPQTINEGLTLTAQVHISADRRYVRANFMEQSLEIEGIEKVKVLLDDTGVEAVGELVSAKEASVSQARYIPDGGSILLPLGYRPRVLRTNDRWLVAQITPRIYIEEEERVRRGLPPK